jgi:hypothetical protein
MLPFLYKLQNVEDTIDYSKDYYICLMDGEGQGQGQMTDN